MKSVGVPQQFVGWRTGCAVLQVFVLYKKRLIKANSFSNGLTHFGYWSFLCLAKTKKTGFLMFQGGTRRDQWHDISGVVS